MKQESSKTVTATVEGNTYERHERGVHFRKTYTGTLLEVLRKITDAHNYSWEESDTAFDLLAAIKESNGDGCDDITKLVIDGTRHI